jgi:hypothetical protein
MLCINVMTELGIRKLLGAVHVRNLKLIPTDKLIKNFTHSWLSVDNKLECLSHPCIFWLVCSVPLSCIILHNNTQHFYIQHNNAIVSILTLDSYGGCHCDKYHYAGYDYAIMLARKVVYPSCRLLVFFI